MVVASCVWIVTYSNPSAMVALLTVAEDGMGKLMEKEATRAPAATYEE
jgi:hypothetical protein